MARTFEPTGKALPRVVLDRRLLFSGGQNKVKAIRVMLRFVVASKATVTSCLDSDSTPGLRTCNRMTQRFVLVPHLECPSLCSSEPGNGHKKLGIPASVGEVRRIHL